MPRLYTADELIATVKLRAAVPGTNATGTGDADILRYLNEEQMTTLVPALIRVREEYLVVTERRAMSASSARYRLPHRAAGQSLRDVNLVDSLTAQTPRRTKIPRVALEGIDRQDPSFNAGPGGFYLQGDDLMLTQIDPGAYAGIELAYHFRPGELVLVANTRKITAVNTATKTVTVSSATPSTWAACTQREPQVATAWGDGEIGFTANLGKWGNDKFPRRTLYVYVIGADGAPLDTSGLAVQQGAGGRGITQKDDIIKY